MKEYLRFSLVLLLICIFSAFGLSLVNRFTRPKILGQLEKEEKDALFEVIPEAEEFIPVEKNDEVYYYKAFDKEKNLLGFAFKAKKRGYAGDILTMAGICPDGKIIAIKILSHNETPGIGSKICEVKVTQTIWEKLRKNSSQTKEEKPWFWETFKGKDAKNLDKEVETISGATISSEAVIESIKMKTEEILKEIQNER